MNVEPNLPNHIAFIPDGNRRWAKEKGILASLGHEAGFKSAEDVIRAAQDAGVKYVSIWGCSVGNVTKRDTLEVQFLYKIFKDATFQRLLDSPETNEKGVRVRVLGEWRQYFPPDLQAKAEELMQKTATNDRFHLTFLMAYSGVAEMQTAIKSLKAAESAENSEITWQTVKNHLYTKDLPPVDLVIRTGNEPHLSEGFMMWDTTNAQLYFSEKMWPDFTTEDLKAVLEIYSGRERRLGK